MVNRLIMIIGLQAGKNCHEFLVHLQMIQVSGFLLGYNRNIQRTTEKLTVSPKQFSNPPLEPISTNSIADFATHRYPQSRKFTSGDNYHYKMGGMITFSLATNMPEFNGTTNPAFSGEGLFIFHPLFDIIWL